MRKLKIYLLAILTVCFLSGPVKAFLPPCPVLPPCPDIDAGTDVQEVLSAVQTQAQNIQAQMTAYMQQINQQAKAMFDSYMDKAKAFVGGIYKNARKKALAGVKELKKSKIAKDTDPMSVQEAMYKLFFQYPVDCQDKNKPENVDICRGYQDKAKEFHQDKVIEIYTLARQMEADLEKLEQAVKDIDEKTQENNEDALTAWTNSYNTYQTLSSVLKLIQELEAIRLQYIAAQAIGSESVTPSHPVSKDKKAMNDYFVEDNIKLAASFTNKSTISFAEVTDDEEELDYGNRLKFVETPADLKDPYADNRENLALLAKITEANNYLKEAVEMHNYILNLPSYKAIYKNYQKNIKIHQAAIDAIKRTEQCAIRYYGEMYENPAKMWNGNLSENYITNYDLRKGISGWAVKALILAKAEDTGTVASAEDFEEADYDESADPNDLTKLEESIGKDVQPSSSGFKDANKEKQVNAELKESRRIPWNIGAEAAKMLAEDQLKNGKDGSWGKAKVLYPVWKDTQSYYNQYIEGKYDSIAKSLDAFNTNELALDVASKLIDVLSDGKERTNNKAGLTELKNKLKQDREEAVSEVDALIAEKKQKITSIYNAKETKMKKLEQEEKALINQINQKQANVDKETLTLQNLKDEKIKAEQEVSANERLVETIYEHELQVPNTKVFETTTEEYKKDLNAGFTGKQSYNIYQGFYKDHNLVANAQIEKATLQKSLTSGAKEIKEAPEKVSEKVVDTKDKTISAKEAETKTLKTSVQALSQNKLEDKDLALQKESALEIADEEVIDATAKNITASGVKQIIKTENPVSVNTTSVAKTASSTNTKTVTSNATTTQKVTTITKQSNNTGYRTTPKVSITTEPQTSLTKTISMSEMVDEKEKEPNVMPQDVRTYNKVIVTEKEVEEEEPDRLLLAKEDLAKAREDVLRLTTEVPAQEQKVENLKAKLQEDKDKLELIKAQKENVNKNYVNETREATILYDTRIAKAEQDYAAALAKYNNVDLAQYYKSNFKIPTVDDNGEEYLFTLPEILADANMLVNDTKGAAREVINETVQRINDINEQMYTREIRPQQEGNTPGHIEKVTAEHAQLIEHLKNLNDQDLVSFSEGIQKYSSYSGIMSLLKNIYKAYITNDACQQDVCKVPDKECFVSNNGKRRDFLAPARVPDSPLPSVRDVVYFDYSDYDSIPQGDNGLITKEGLLENMTYIPDIWKKILSSPAYIEKDIDLSAVIKPSEAKLANAGKYPCWYDEGKNYLVTSYDEGNHKSGYVIYYKPESIMVGLFAQEDTESIKQREELLKKNYQQCSGFELTVSHNNATVYNPANDIKGSGKLKPFSSFKPAETESELGYLFEYNNGLKFNAFAKNVFKALSDANKKQDGEGKIEDILDSEISMEKTQLGEFLKAVDYEQESLQNLEESKVSLDETKEELKELFSRLKFSMASDFDLTRDSDYNAARSSLLNYRNEMLKKAKNSVSALQGNDNEVIKERMDRINNLIGVLQKDSEVLVSIGDDTENNSKLDEEIKAQKANKEVIARQEQEEEKSFEQQLKFIEDPYCGQLVDNL